LLAALDAIGRLRKQFPVLNPRASLAATAERPFCKSGTDGSNPVSSSGESATNCSATLGNSVSACL
jgi:hypothetical protein